VQRCQWPAGEGRRKGDGCTQSYPRGVTGRARAPRRPDGGGGGHRAPLSGAGSLEAEVSAARSAPSSHGSRARSPLAPGGLAIVFGEHINPRADPCAPRLPPGGHSASSEALYRGPGPGLSRGARRSGLRDQPGLPAPQALRSSHPEASAEVRGGGFPPAARDGRRIRFSGVSLTPAAAAEPGARLASVCGFEQEPRGRGAGRPLALAPRPARRPPGLEREARRGAARRGGGVGRGGRAEE
jgi:hypothetical protein